MTAWIQIRRNGHADQIALPNQRTRRNLVRPGIVVWRGYRAIPQFQAPYIATSAADIVAECISVFAGTVESIKHDEDVVHVICKLEAR